MFSQNPSGPAGLKWELRRAAVERQKVRIEAVATDLSPAYLCAVLTHLPNVVHVFDHFHIIKLYNEGLSDLRRKLYHEATHGMDQKVLKGTRWLLLKNPENLDSNRREAERRAERVDNSINLCPWPTT